MWPDFVVPTSEVAQKQVYGFPVSQHDLPELVLQRPEQPFNPPVLPRAVQVDPLVFDAQQCQARAERAAGEAPLVVGAHESGFAVFRYRQTQVTIHPFRLALAGNFRLRICSGTWSPASCLRQFELIAPRAPILEPPCQPPPDHGHDSGG